MALPLPTIAPLLVRRDRDPAQPRPTALPKRNLAAVLQARCEDCLTTTVTQTYYVDESGQSTTCTTTQTAYHTNTLSPSQSAPTPTPTLQYQTVFHTLTSTIAAAVATATATIPTTTSVPVQPVDYPRPSQAASCQCEQDWVKAFIGGLPKGAKDVMA
jgi:hypothetical protein